MTQIVHSAQAPTQRQMPTGGRWGWYTDHEGREWRRVSKLVKYVETDTYNLDQWMKRQVAEGLAIRDDLVLAVKAMGRPDATLGWSDADKKKLNEIARDAMNAAKQADGARSGTAMHDLTERLDRGESVDNVTRGLPAAAGMSLRAYAFLREANGWRNVEIERTVVVDELEVAGTFDRIDIVPGLVSLLGPGSCQYGDECPDVGLPGHGDAAVVDVKTEKAPWLNGLHIGPQLAIYSRAQRMWEPDGTVVPLLYADGRPKMRDDGAAPLTTAGGRYVRVPCVRQDVGIVVHVLDGDAVPYFINLAEGWGAAVAAYEQMRREQRSKTRLGAPGAWFVPVPNVKRPAVTQIFTEHAVAADYANPARPAAGGAEQVAVRGVDGLVRWEGEAPAENVATRGPLDEVDKSAIEAIWLANVVNGGDCSLSKIFEIYTGMGRLWSGRVAEAATARRRQLECPQRALHVGAGKCACGWVTGVAP